MMQDNVPYCNFSFGMMNLSSHRLHEFDS